MKLLVLKKGHTLVTDEKVDVGTQGILQQMSDVLAVRAEAKKLMKEEGFSLYVNTGLSPEAIELGKRILSADEMEPDGQYVAMRPMQGG